MFVPNAIMLRQIISSTNKSATCSVQPALSSSTLRANFAAKSAKPASTQVVPHALAATLNLRYHILMVRIVRIDAIIESLEMP